MGEFGVVFQNEPVDVSEEFSRQENHFFVGDRVEEFDPEAASGKICWKTLALKQRVSYHQITTLFFEYPEDRASWLVEDQYFFGTDILVAPLMEEARSRDIYLPPGRWIDYQGGEVYEGARWHHARAGEIPIVMLVRDGAAIPHARLAQSTGRIEWSEIELRVFGTGDSAEGYFCHPEDGGLHLLRLAREGGGFALGEDPLDGRVNWKVRPGPRSS